MGGLLFALGCSLEAGSTSFAMLLAGRFFSGAASGVVCTVVPAYLAEIAPAKRRGAVTAVFHLMIVFGFFVRTCVFVVLENEVGSIWRIAFVVPAVVAGLMVAAASFIPDSEQATGQAEWSEFLSGRTLRSVITVFALRFFWQFSGINETLFYSLDMLYYVGFKTPDTKVLFPLVNSLIEVVYIFPCFTLVDRLGRKPLLIGGATVILLSHVGLYFSLTAADNSVSDDTANETAAWVAVFCMYLVVVAYAATWGPIVWTLQVELFPLRERAKGIGLATLAQWLWLAISVFAWPKTMEDEFPPQKYWAFAAFSAFAVVGAFFVPETRKKELEEIGQ
ncbi:major facilitator superfamily domain-containing protein [Zopfochytrium polystomum]|nr:major facilitator superfamily domain-containing protein [Zopfochytrium polystomum]